MKRYDVGMGVEGESEPGSRHRVMRNLLGVRTKREMDQIEEQALRAVQDCYYTEGEVTPDTRFAADLIRKMHRDWLGGIYEWAGEYRSVDMARGGFVFPPAVRVAENMGEFERSILATHTPCRPRGLKKVCESLAVVHAELILIHPFREGNGRIARWLADMMVAQAGFPLPRYGFSGEGSRRSRAGYLGAVISGYGKDYDDLAAFFEAAILRRLWEEEQRPFRERGEAPSNTAES